MSFIGELAAVAAVEAAEKVMVGELGLGQIERYVKDAMDKFFEKYGPSMAQQFAAVAEPAAKKASEIIGPVVEQKLKDYGPTFAVTMGAVLGAAILFGGWFFGRKKKKTVRRWAA